MSCLAKNWHSKLQAVYQDAKDIPVATGQDTSTRQLIVLHSGDAAWHEAQGVEHRHAAALSS